MITFKVKNEGGESFDVDQDKLHEAEADGFLPVVSNGSEEHRVESKDFSLAEKDGFKPVQASNMSDTEASVRGAVQGIPFAGSYADEATGALESAAGSLGLVPDKTYKQARDESRQKYKEAEEFHPVPYYGAMTAAALPVDTAKLFPLLGQGLGAVEGAAYGLGASEADVLGGDVAGAARDTAIGGGIGFIAPKVLNAVGSKVLRPLAGKAGEVLSSGAQSLGKKLGIGAEKLAENATGATGAQLSKFREGAGRELLDRGLVRFGDDPAKIAERAGEAQKAASDAINGALNDLDARGVEANVDNIVNEIGKKISELRGDPSQSNVVRQLEREVENIIETSPSRIPVSAAEATKRGYQNKVNWLSPESNPGNAAVSSVYKNEVENVAKAADPKIAETFKSAKDTYGLLAPIEEAASKRANQLAQHPFGGFNDMASGVIGGASGGAPGVAMGVAAKRALLPRAASAAAVTTDKVSKLLQSAPERLGKFAKPLQDAMSRGGNSLGVTHFLLQSIDPEYQQLMQEDEDDR